MATMSNIPELQFVTNANVTQGQVIPIDYSTHPAATPSTYENAQNVDDLPDLVLASILSMANDSRGKQVCKRWRRLHPTTINDLSNEVISRVLLYANNPACRKVCKRWHFIEETLSGLIQHTNPDDEPFQRKRIRSADTYQEIKHEIDFLPEPARKRFKPAFAMMHDEPAKQELDSCVLELCQKDPLLASLVTKNFIPQDITFEQMQAAAQAWIATKSQTCESFDLDLEPPSAIPDVLQHMPCLRKLSIISSIYLPPMTFPDWFFHLPLAELSLNCDLTTLPPALCTMQTLQKLDVVGNNLTSIPPELAQLPNLQQANFQFKKFNVESIPEVLKPLIESGKIVLKTRDRCTIL